MMKIGWYMLYDIRILMIWYILSDLDSIWYMVYGI